MARVRKFGKPDLFVTFTCNPKWKEITDALLSEQTTKDRPNLVTRVFNLKFDALLKDIKDGVLGNVIAKIWVIEFQKRGLPHAHILLILDEVSKLRTAEDYDLMVSVEIPDPICHPKVYETVTSCMVHGPCGPDFFNAQCMEQGKCKKRYPRSFSEETRCDVDGYPEYRRHQTRIFVDPKTQRVADNQRIISYNFHLATKYHAHINMEICLSISTIKYLYKYVYKGPNRAITVVERQGNMPSQDNNAQLVTANGEWQNRNEIKAYLEGHMSLLPRHHGIFSLLECMTGHRLSHALPCTNLECIRLCTMIMQVFLKLLIASKTKKQRSPNTSKPILITPWPKKSRTWIFPSCLHGPSGGEGVVSGAFISSVLLFANVISCIHC